MHQYIVCHCKAKPLVIMSVPGFESFGFGFKSYVNSDLLHRAFHCLNITSLLLKITKVLSNSFMPKHS